MPLGRTWCAAETAPPLTGRRAGWRIWRRTGRPFARSRVCVNGSEPEEAVAKYAGDRYIQHNPQAADGPEAFIGFGRASPDLSVEIKRIAAEDDIVVTHGLVKSSPDDRGTVAANLFRSRTARSSST